jgi:hypothetical protein
MWAITAAGRRIPLDPDPVPDGNVELVAGRAIVLGRGVSRPAGAVLYVSHFATCPNAGKHRRNHNREL